MTISILAFGAIGLVWLYFDDQRRQRFEASVIEATRSMPARRAITIDAMPMPAPMPSLADEAIELLDDADLVLVDDLEEATIADSPFRPSAMPSSSPPLVCKPASLPRFSERFGARRSPRIAVDSDTIPGAAYST